MRRSDSISHRGRVVEVAPDCTTVEIISESACGSCHAAGLCGLGESKKKYVSVPSSLKWKEGDEVNVVLERSMGFKAVWIAYAIPLLVLLAVLLPLIFLGAGELVAGLCAIAAVGVYYLIIYLIRDRISNEWSFRIEQ